MSNELYIAYWSGEEPTGPGKSPTLDMTPDYVDVVVLFYVMVQDGGVLDLPGWFCTTTSKRSWAGCGISASASKIIRKRQSSRSGCSAATALPVRIPRLSPAESLHILYINLPRSHFCVHDYAA